MTLGLSLKYMGLALLVFLTKDLVFTASKIESFMILYVMINLDFLFFILTKYIDIFAITVVALKQSNSEINPLGVTKFSFILAYIVSLLFSFMTLNALYLLV